MASLRSPSRFQNWPASFETFLTELQRKTYHSRRGTS
jgi:hypothetical protein